MSKVYLYSVLQIPDGKKYAEKPRTLQENLINSYNKQLFVDAEIKIQNRFFKVHKCILAFYSPIFHKAFYGSKVPSSLCIINDINPVGFDVVLRFLYSSKIPLLANTSYLVDAYAAAEFLAMTGIQEKLISYIFYSSKRNEKPIIERKFWSFLEKSHSLKLTELEAKFLKFAKTHAKSILNQEDFSKTKSQIIKLVLNVKVLAISGNEILERIAHWKDSNSNLESLEQSVQDLLSCVDFERLSPREFYNIVSKYDDLISGKDALDILMHLMDPTASSLPKWCSLDDKDRNVPMDASLNKVASNFKASKKIDKYKSVEDLLKVNNLDSVKDRRKLQAFKSQQDLRKLDDFKTLEGWSGSKFDLEDNSYAKTLPESFRQMLEEGLFTDVNLCDSNGTKIPAHRLILALGSGVFANMLYGDKPTNTLHLEETADELKAMLRYFYGTGEKLPCKYASIPVDSVLRKFDVALKYECYPLIQICWNVFYSTFVSPCAFWKLLGQENQSENYTVNTELLMKYALISPKKVFNHESFYGAAKSSLIRVLESDCINMSEYDILEYVTSWLEKNSKNFLTDHSRKELFKYIRFEALNAEQFFSFLKLHDNLLPKEDAFAILTYLFRESKENSLPKWCYCGPLRSFFYDALTKIGTDVLIPWKNTAEKGRNSFRCTYTATLSNCSVECQIQYLELSWRVKPNKIGLHMNHKCSVTVKYDGYEPLTFNDIDVSEYQRIIVPAFFTLNNEKRKIHFNIEVNTRSYYIYYFISQRRLTFENVIFEANSSIFCVSDAIVDNCTSEQIHIPKNLLPKNQDAVVATEKCFKVITEGRS